MKTTPPADLHRWSEELARNPASLAFLPLARTYRRLSRQDLAMKLCLRGLEHHPMHVEAHSLLALLYFEAGERAKAADEWATVLRLKPGNFDALRGMGFRHLEQGDLAKAKQHLERAALIRPDDTTVQEALRLIRQREAAPARPAAPATTPAAGPRQPSVPSPAAAQSARPAPARRPRAPRPAPVVPRFEPGWEPEPGPARPAPGRGALAPGMTWAAPPPDPARLFESLAVAEPILGVLLLDRRGLVLAGGLTGAKADAAENLGANLGGAVEEVLRTTRHLDLGAWQGITLECREAVLQLRPVSSDTLVAVAAKRDAPTGWVARATRHAASLAERFVEVYS